jgi:predicted metal-binding membrane protein
MSGATPWLFRPVVLWRPLVWVGFYAVVLASWAALFMLSRAPVEGISAREYWASLCVAAGESDPAILFGMWALMTAAMMLPTFVPALRVYAGIGAVGASDARGMAALVAGYATVWLGFAAGVTLLQIGLARAGAMTGDGRLLPWGSVALLLVAGAWQFSMVKAACLSRCRHPLTFFLEHWRPGAAQAARMGARLGLHCIGCCWALMLLGFVGGAMNLLWMGAATLFMTLEKLPVAGRYLTRPAGIALLAAGALVALQTLQPM